jgi:ribulose-phosphate 3-epimerase
MVEILPSILAADFARLGEQVRAVEDSVRMLHLDVMDGRFVPNISFGPPVVRSLRRATALHLDVHLMIDDPDRYLADFVKAGAESISVHQEACRHLDRTLRAIQELGIPAGVVINPATPVSAIEEVLELADFVLVMSVNPGFGGQKFLPGALRKVEQLARLRSRARLGFKIEIDGGIDANNVGDAAQAGCDWIVAGTSVFGAADPAAAVRGLAMAARDAVAARA